MFIQSLRHHPMCCLERFEEDERTPPPAHNTHRLTMDFETAALRMMMSRYFRGRTRFRMAVRFVISQVRSNRSIQVVGETLPTFRVVFNRLKEVVIRRNQQVIDASRSIRVEHQGERRAFVTNHWRKWCFSLLTAEDNYHDWKIIPNYNYDPVGFAKWALLAPIKVLFHFTIPDCRNPRSVLRSLLGVEMLDFSLLQMVSMVSRDFHDGHRLVVFLHLSDGLDGHSDWFHLRHTRQRNGDHLPCRGQQCSWCTEQCSRRSSRYLESVKEEVTERLTLCIRQVWWTWVSRIRSVRMCSIFWWVWLCHGLSNRWSVAKRFTSIPAGWCMTLCCYSALLAWQ